MEDLLSSARKLIDDLNLEEYPEGLYVLLAALLGAWAGASLAGRQARGRDDRQRRKDNQAAVRAVFYEAYANSFVLASRASSGTLSGHLSNSTFLAQLPRLAEHLPELEMETVFRAYQLIPTLEGAAGQRSNPGEPPDLSASDKEHLADGITETKRAFRALWAYGWPETPDDEADKLARIEAGDRYNPDVKEEHDQRMERMPRFRKRRTRR